VTLPLSAVLLIWRSGAGGRTLLMACLQLLSSLVSAIVLAGSTHASLSSVPLSSVTNAEIVIVTLSPGFRSHLALFA
jgi:hypothetical protein